MNSDLVGFFTASTLPGSLPPSTPISAGSVGLACPTSPRSPRPASAQFMRRASPNRPRSRRRPRRTGDLAAGRGSARCGSPLRPWRRRACAARSQGACPGTLRSTVHATVHAVFEAVLAAWEDPGRETPSDREREWPPPLRRGGARRPSVGGGPACTRGTCIALPSQKRTRVPHPAQIDLPRLSESTRCLLPDRHALRSRISGSIHHAKWAGRQSCPAVVAKRCPARRSSTVGGDI